MINVRSWRRPHRAASLWITAAALVAASCSGGEADTSTSEVKVQTYGGIQADLPIIVAAEKGFDSRHGVKIELTPLKTGTTGTAAVIGGSLDVGAASVNDPMSSVASGANVQIIDGFLPHNIYSLIGSDRTTPQSYPTVMQDLVNTKIGVSARGGTTDLMARTLFKGAGIDTNKVTFTAVGAVDTGYAALLKHRVSAYLGYAPLPYICEVEHTCKVLVNLGEGAGPSNLASLNGAFQVYYASGDFIKKHTQTVKNFVAAVDDAIAWITNPKNLPELIKIAQENIKVGTAGSSQVVKKLSQDSTKLFASGVSRDAIRAWSSFLLSNKQIKKPVSPEQLVWSGAPRSSS